MLVEARQLASTIAETVVPYHMARLVSVSPRCTVYRRHVEGTTQTRVGVGCAVAVGLGDVGLGGVGLGVCVEVGTVVGVDVEVAVG
jgi:hypothetical protein